MKRVLPFLLVVLATPANAQIVDIKKDTYWTLSAGYAGLAQNVPVCMVSTTMDTRFFSFKYFGTAKDRITVQFTNTEWNIKDGTVIPIEMSFGNHFWSGSAGTIPNMDTGLEFGITIDNVEQFAKELTESFGLTLSFPSESENDWRISLAGLDSLYDGFGKCIGVIEQSN